MQESTLQEDKISIHAPTRGATVPRLACAVFTMISIHAPTRGATRVEVRFVVLACISIHAPTRGATFDNYNIIQLNYFNPRSHTGSDRHVPAKGQALCISIHAPTRGATSERTQHCCPFINFNPRSHTGSD